MVQKLRHQKKIQKNQRKRKILFSSQRSSTKKVGQKVTEDSEKKLRLCDCKDECLALPEDRLLDIGDECYHIDGTHHKVIRKSK